MSRRLAERASDVLGRHVGRRGFLAGSAVVGSALVSAPVQFALRPGHGPRRRLLVQRLDVRLRFPLL